MAGTPKRFVLHNQAREFVSRLHEYFERELQNGGPLLPLSQVRERVAKALGISAKTVSRISREKHGKDNTEDNCLLSAPLKKRVKRSVVTHVDNFDANAIRNHINSYYSRNELPTLDKLSISLRESGLFSGSRSSLWKVLKKIGYSYKKMDNKKLFVMVECKDIEFVSCPIQKYEAAEGNT